MSTGTFLGLITLGLMSVFVGIVVWAYGLHRAQDFDAMARLPLDEGDRS